MPLGILAAIIGIILVIIYITVKFGRLYYQATRK
jgi:flagellar biogenesis protein FliO